MLDQIILFSIRNKLIVGLLTLILVIWGGWSVTQLPIDAVPDITNNQVQIITVSPSLAAQDIERLVTFPVEVGLANIPGLIELRSFSRFGLSIVTVVFSDETDVYWARQQIAERLQNVKDQIPRGPSDASVGMPVMAPVTTGLGEIFQYTVVAKKGYETRYSLAELRTIQDWIIRRQLLGTPGVADVSSLGGQIKQYEIAVDPDKLRSLNLTIADLFTALEKNNQNTGGAYIDKKPNAYFIRSDGLLGSTDDIGTVVVHLNDQSWNAVPLPIRIRDVATVQMGSAVRYGAISRNGTGEVVGAVVMMLKGENSSKVINLVKDKITEIRKTLPEGVEIIPFLDRTKMVDSAIGTVTRNLAEGALIVIFVLVLLLGEWRAGMVVASVIPLALLFAISLMNVFGVSGNLMSLGAIDFGLIVDGAVIIVEATLHHILLRNRDRTLTQTQMDEEVYESASRIRNSAAFGEIIILIVYLPVLALSGVEGKMFRPMALTVAFAILGAFILSLTYVPMISSVLLNKTVRHRNTFSDRLMVRLHRAYEPLLLRALRFRLPVLAVGAGLLALCVVLFNRMGGEFLPTLDEGDFAVDTRVLTGSSLSESVEATTKAQQILLSQFPEVEQVVGKTGSGAIPTDPMSIEASDLMVILKKKEAWTSAGSRDELAQKMAAALSVLPGVSFGFQQPVQMRFNELMTGVRQDVALKIYGDDLGELSRQAAKVATLIRTIDGAKDLYVEQVEGLSQILVKLDRNQIAKYGLNVSDVNRTINTAFAGQIAGQVYEGEKRFDLVVRLASDKRQTLDDVRNLYIAGPNGQLPLAQLAQVSMELAPNQIQRDNTHRRITLGFNVRNRDVESIVGELRQKVDKHIKLPPGYSITYGGQFENLIEAKRRLSIAVPVALALIFALLYFTFRSVRQSLLIFTAIPLAAIGGVLALLLRGMPFSISAGVGFIALFGVAVLNGIVLIGEFNRLRHDEGLTDMREIIRRGTQVRLRPVFMTALVASLGFIPMAISNSGGAEVQKPLATVVIGGLISATLLTLFVLPILYTYFERGLTRLGRLPKKATTSVGMVLLLLVARQGYAQPAPVRTLPLDQALLEAATRNPQIQIGGLQVGQQQALRRSVYDYGRTTITGTMGQINSRKFDNNLTVSQIVPNATLLRRQADLADATIHSRETALEVSRNEVQYAVKSAYYELSYLHEREHLFRQQDSVLVEFVRAATLRLRAGEASSLEKSTAEIQLADGRVKLAQNTASLTAARTRLQTALNSPTPLDATPGPLARRVLTLPFDSLTTVRNPLLAQLRQQVVLAQQTRLVEQARLKPDLTVGMFSQTIVGSQIFNNTETYYGAGHRFFGGHIGVSLLLQTKPQRARIDATRLGEQIAQTELQSGQQALQWQVEQASQQYEQYRQALQYYEQNGLAQAQLIQANARKAFQGGDIGYVEFTLALQQSLNIRASYLDLLNQYNQSVLYIEYLLGD